MVVLNVKYVFRVLYFSTMRNESVSFYLTVIALKRTHTDTEKGSEKRKEREKKILSD